jgi:hypothetical protein
VEGIREITSDAREGRGSVTIELVGGADRMKAFQDIDQAVSRIRTFPDDIEEPEVACGRASRRGDVGGLFGPVDVWTLRGLAERLRDELLAIPSDHAGRVEQRVPEYVTHVEIPRRSAARVRAHADRTSRADRDVEQRRRCGRGADECRRDSCCGSRRASSGRSSLLGSR